jgi:sensory rhodopsin
VTLPTDALLSALSGTDALGALASVAPRLQSAGWAQGLYSEQEIYWATAGLMAVVAVLFLLWTLRLPSRRRRYGLLVVYTSVVLTVTYVGMANAFLRYESIDGAAVPVTRFVGYGFGTTVVLMTTSWVGGYSRRLQLMLLVPFVGISVGTLGSWFFASPLSSLASLSSLLSLPLVAFVLKGPGVSAAADMTDDRQLLHGKLGNVVLLAWVGYLVVGITSRQNLALLDGFAGVFIGVYIDVLLYVGFGALLLRSGVALDQMAGVDHDAPPVGDAGDGGRDAPASAE